MSQKSTTAVVRRMKPLTFRAVVCAAFTDNRYQRFIVATRYRITSRHNAKWCGNRRFTSPDGSAQFAYYSFENSRGESPANFLRRTLVMKPEQIIYRRIMPNFFVVSSIRNENIFYSRCNFSRRVKCFYMEYPAEQKRSWDRTVTRMSYSLR